jgi:acyl-coenzyme A thioesterase PaaI-like protein
MSRDGAPPPRMCYGCGAENKHGLHMAFRSEGDRTVCDFEPVDFQQGYPGRMHGGVVSTMIDEAMGWAVYHSRKWGTTARLSVRYRRPVDLARPLRVEAWITAERHRLIELRAEVRDEAGALLADGEGTYMLLDSQTASMLSALARHVGRDDAPEVVP